MYFSNAPHIIEASDIEAVHSVNVERLPDGSIVASLTLQLKPHKDYTASPSLHVTDGISHRVLDPMPAPVVEEETPSSTPKGKKAAKQEESTSDAS